MIHIFFFLFLLSSVDSIFLFVAIKSINKMENLKMPTFHLAHGFGWIFSPDDSWCGRRMGKDGISENRSISYTYLRTMLINRSAHNFSVLARNIFIASKHLLQISRFCRLRGCPLFSMSFGIANRTRCSSIYTFDTILFDIPVDDGRCALLNAFETHLSGYLLL